MGYSLQRPRARVDLVAAIAEEKIKFQWATHFNAHAHNLHSICRARSRRSARFNGLLTSTPTRTHRDRPNTHAVGIGPRFNGLLTSTPTRTARRYILCLECSIERVSMGYSLQRPRAQRSVRHSYATGSDTEFQWATHFNAHAHPR